MDELLHHAGQERVVSGKSKTLLVEVVKHVVGQHVLQNGGVSSHSCWDVFTNCGDQLDIDGMVVSK